MSNSENDQVRVSLLIIAFVQPYDWGILFQYSPAWNNLYVAKTMSVKITFL